MMRQAKARVFNEYLPASNPTQCQEIWWLCSAAMKVSHDLAPVPRGKYFACHVKHVDKHFDNTILQTISTAATTDGLRFCWG
jgi:hypothetical protein